MTPALIGKRRAKFAAGVLLADEVREGLKARVTGLLSAELTSAAAIPHVNEAESQQACRSPDRQAGSRTCCDLSQPTTPAFRAIDDSSSTAGYKDLSTRPVSAELLVMLSSASTGTSPLPKRNMAL